MDMRHGLLALILVGGITAIFYFSWLPKPNLERYGILPRWLSHWTDNNDNMNVRTAVPFFILGVLCGGYLIMAKKAWNNWLGVWLLLVVVVSIAEAGQLLLPFRHFDWGDIVWGAAGAFAGLLPLGLLRFVSPKTRW